jgi:8-amino-3,8-dideoxy-alpha-D-manno-octulosonate transaminase
MKSRSATLAIHGGPKAVRARAPASHLHGAQELGREEVRAVTAVLRSKNLFRFFKKEGDSATARFEERFRRETGVRHALAVNSGTSALVAGLVGVGVSTGDEVLVPAYTYIATAAAVLAVRAIPVLVEVDESLTMDPRDLERKVTRRTRCVVPVHMRGVPCRMREILGVARRRGLKVLEDCAQANGGSYRGRMLGSLGDAGAFSLQHFKIITCGEGGVVTTNAREVFERAACHHDSAYAFWKEKGMGIRPFLGENYRMSELAGAVALEQLKKRARILSRMRAIKRRFAEEMAGLPGIRLQDVPDPRGDCGCSAVFFTETAARTKAVARALVAEGVRAGTMFNKGFPDRHVYYHWDYVLQKRTPDAYGRPWKDPARPCRVRYSRGMCPATVDLLDRAVALPITQRMSDAYVRDCLRAVAKVLRGM